MKNTRKEICFSAVVKYLGISNKQIDYSLRVHVSNAKPQVSLTVPNCDHFA